MNLIRMMSGLINLLHYVLPPVMYCLLLCTASCYVLPPVMYCLLLCTASCYVLPPVMYCLLLCTASCYVLLLIIYITHVFNVGDVWGGGFIYERHPYICDICISSLVVEHQSCKLEVKGSIPFWCFYLVFSCFSNSLTIATAESTNQMPASEV
jgi:hypothetical protein